jgi:hypothetical protein
MEKALSRREQNFVREQTDDNDDEHDANNLIHGTLRAGRGRQNAIRGGAGQHTLKECSS